VFFTYLTAILTVKTRSRQGRNRCFCVKNGAALAAALKIPIFTGKAIPFNYFASGPKKAKLSYLQPFAGEKDTFFANLK
jgi:hypothetical protein